MEILQKQTSLFTGEKSTSLPEAFLANHTAAQESEKERKTNAICGPKCLEQLGRFNQIGLWEKTFSALLIGMEGWYSKKCKLTWKLKGTKYKRMYFQLAPSTLPTEEIESVLWLISPTSVQIERKEIWKKKTEKQFQNQSRKSFFNNKTISLLDSVKYAQLKKMLPTPTYQNYKGSEKRETLIKRGRIGKNGNGSNLVQTFSQIGKTSQLNPLFVMEMMGFPPNWTELPFLNGETNQSKQEETQ